MIEVDIKPFLQTAQLLYGGPWVAERFAAVGRFVKEHAEAVHPVVRDIILGGEKYSAVEAFNGQYALEKFRQETSDTWNLVDFLLLPTAPDIFRIAEVRERSCGAEQPAWACSQIFLTCWTSPPLRRRPGSEPTAYPLGLPLLVKRSRTVLCSRSLPTIYSLCVPASAGTRLSLSGHSRFRQGNPLRSNDNRRCRCTSDRSTLELSAHGSRRPIRSDSEDCSLVPTFCASWHISAEARLDQDRSRRGRID